MPNRHSESDKVFAFIKDGNVHGYSVYKRDVRFENGFEIVEMNKKEADELFEELFFGKEK